MRIAVIGMGKIGLPIAAQFAGKGHTVTGVDINPHTVDAINAAVTPFPGEAHLEEYLKRLVPRGLLSATTSYEDAVPEADVVVVVVPLFVDDDGKPDFAWMDSATRDVGAHLTPGTLVCYETTLPVGTTRNRWKPMLESTSALAEGSDFHAVFSPERVLTGRVFADLRRYPKIIGGLSPQGAQVAVDFYRAVLDFDERTDLPMPNGVWDLGSAEAAELTKLAETTYRDVNIGLANQFALFAQGAGIDIYKVIAAANSQPYSHIHSPGISVGGHCIPVYPRLLLSNYPQATIVEAARRVNADMPAHAVALLAREYGDLTGSSVAILGAAYRHGVKETAFSGVFQTAAEVLARGGSPLVHDPTYSADELNALDLVPYELGSPVDAAILHTAHPEYAELTDHDLPGARILLDGRGVIREHQFASIKVVSLGIGTLDAGAESELHELT